MKKLTISIALAAATLGGFALTPAHAQVGVSITIGEPPPPRVEPVPPPRYGYIWAPGYWDWVGERHVWREGHWEQERPGYVYRAPAWHHGERGWELNRGGWDQDHGPRGREERRDERRDDRRDEHRGDRHDERGHDDRGRNEGPGPGFRY
ncbi:putative signal peptide protein [Pandoraea terrae]|uniref:Putative signal peptide protein n=1 Tax=Pandoraea terrae TaxID=1537710 RepID=A0A5E4SUR6_9BURK|nr:YXWGXW repeat-containing protein [Pandoraea terrae]VVD78513.1 putative signal peptide protein [Pandoraea terrae]